MIPKKKICIDLKTVLNYDLSLTKGEVDVYRKYNFFTAHGFLALEAISNMC